MRTLTEVSPDGKNIEALVISVFVNLMTAVVEAGMFYLAIPPLYGWELPKPEVVDGIKYKYKFTSNLDEIPKGVNFTRYKGLGQMDPDEFWEAVMSPRAERIKIDLPTDLEDFNVAMTSSSERFNKMKSLGLIEYK